MRMETPKFKSEAEEAKWWFENQDRVTEALEQAQRKGLLGRGRAMKQWAERQASKSMTIRVAEQDLERAKVQAKRKGLRYQTYLKMLLHEALNREEERRTA